MRKLKFILACIPALVLAQESVTSEADAILDELFPIDSLSIEAMVNDLKKQDFLYINTLYNNKTLLWDGNNMKITNFDEANRFVGRERRAGWEL